MARETWAQLRDRLKIELRSRADTDFGTRCEGFLRRSYVELQAVYRFYETDGGPTPLALSTGDQTVSLAGITDLRYVMNLRNTGTKRRIKKGAYRNIDKRDFTMPGEPKQYARYGNTLVFDVTADRDYNLSMRYKKRLTEPAFASGTPELPEEWDNVILYRAALYGSHSYFEPERSAWFEDQLNKLIAELPIAEDVETDDDDFGVEVRQ